MKLRGIIPGHRTHLLPNGKGILLSFRNSVVDLNNASIYPGDLHQIKLSNDMRAEANSLITYAIAKKEDKKTWAFCFIDEEEIQEDIVQLEMAMNLKFLPEIRTYSPDDYEKEFESQGIKARFEKVIDIDGWKLPGALSDLEGEMDKEIWLP